MKDKHDLTDLALFGGQRAFHDPLHVGRPNFGDEEAFARRVQGIFALRRFTNDGPLVREFEARVAELTRVSDAVATSNATAGLELLARALELRGEVVMPSFTFIATAHAFAWSGLAPVFCDIEERTHGAHPESVERVIDADTSAVVGVHTWGIPCDVEALAQIADRRGIPLILDAASAFSATLGDRPVGSFGVAEVFSFHATKVVNSFEGGMVTTNDRDLAVRLRLLRNFGFTGYDQVVTLATNAKMSEIHAAAGLTTLEALPEIVGENRRCFDRYRGLLRAIPGLRLLDPTSRGRSHFQYVVIELDPGVSGVCRDDLVRALDAEGVIARRYFHPGCHRSAPYAGRAQRVDLPVTERISGSVLSLPTGPSVTDEAIDVVSGLIRLVLGCAEDFNARLADQERTGDQAPAGGRASAGIDPASR